MKVEAEHLSADLAGKLQRTLALEPFIAIRDERWEEGILFRIVIEV